MSAMPDNKVAAASVVSIPKPEMFMRPQVNKTAANSTFAKKDVTESMKGDNNIIEKILLKDRNVEELDPSSIINGSE
jgi:hypothetical protein